MLLRLALSFPRYVCIYIYMYILNLLLLVQLLDSLLRETAIKSFSGLDQIQAHYL